MSKKNQGSELADLNAEVRQIWDANAEWWDDQIGDGNRFQLELIEPASECLLGDLTGKAVLDIACGAGRFARRMAELGAQVTAFDFSTRFIARAKKRTPKKWPITYRVLDATDEKALLALGVGRYDVAVATMAIMDISAIDGLLAGVFKLLKPGGRFVFSIQHPCFQPAEFSRFAEMSDCGGVEKITTGIKVSRYLTPGANKGIGIVGQPQAQWYFHRPLSGLFSACFAQGFVMDGLEEPRLSPPADNRRYLSWDHMGEIPPVMVVRLRAGEKYLH